jgi:hypothetical protein
MAGHKLKQSGDATTGTNGNGFVFDFKIQDPNTFLGGQNVHNLIIIGLLTYVAFFKK